MRLSPLHPEPLFRLPKPFLVDEGRVQSAPCDPGGSGRGGHVHQTPRDRGCDVIHSLRLPVVGSLEHHVLVSAELRARTVQRDDHPPPERNQWSVHLQGDGLRVQREELVCGRRIRDRRWFSGTTQPLLLDGTLTELLRSPPRHTTAPLDQRRRPRTTARRRR